MHLPTVHRRRLLALLLCYSRELRREGRAKHPYLGKALGSFACAKDRAKHTGPPF